MTCSRSGALKGLEAACLDSRLGGLTRAAGPLSGGDRGRGSRGGSGLRDHLHPQAAYSGGKSSTSSWGAPLCRTQPSSPGAETQANGTAPHLPARGAAQGAARPLLGASGRGSLEAEGPGQARSCGGRTLCPGGASPRRRTSAHPARARGPTYHQEVVEQEDFALVQPELLGLVRVRNLEEPAVADEAAVWQRQHLCRGAASAHTPAGDAPCPPPCSRETAFRRSQRRLAGGPGPGEPPEVPVTCSPSAPAPRPSALKDLSPDVRVWGAVWGPELAVVTPRGWSPPSAHTALQGRARPPAGTQEGMRAQPGPSGAGDRTAERGAGGLGHTSDRVLGPDLAASGRDRGGRPGPGGQGEGGRPQCHPEAISSGAGSQGRGTSSTRPRRDTWRPSALGRQHSPPCGAAEI